MMESHIKLNETLGLFRSFPIIPSPLYTIQSVPQLLINCSSVIQKTRLSPQTASNFVGWIFVFSGLHTWYFAPRFYWRIVIPGLMLFYLRQTHRWLLICTVGILIFFKHGRWDKGGCPRYSTVRILYLYVITRDRNFIKKCGKCIVSTVSYGWQWNMSQVLL